MEKLLLHSCCGPCSTVCIERLQSRYDVTVFFFNPNIEPLQEYEKRKAEQKKVCAHFGVAFVDGDYCNQDWKAYVCEFAGEKEGGARCEKCFRFRLQQTARQAKLRGFGLFATTLSVSPHKNSEVINAVGQEVSAQENIPFLPEIFKKKDGYLRSIQLSKELNLYRQNYCGCFYAKNMQSASLEEKTKENKTKEKQR